MPGGCEPELFPDAITPSGVTQRPFGGDMNGIRPEFPEFSGDAAIRKNGEADFGITGAGYGSKGVGRYDGNVVTLPAQFTPGILQSLDDAVYQRFPGVGNNDNFHGRPLRQLGVVERKSFLRGGADQAASFARLLFPPVRCSFRPSRRS